MNDDRNDTTAEDGIVYLLWNDLVGVTRTRGVPARKLEARYGDGLGWACAGQALTPFDDIVENRWGPVDEVRQMPDPAARFAFTPVADAAPIEAVICNTTNNDGTPWNCCARGFLSSALDALKAETGLELVAAFEHEFSVAGLPGEPATPFSFAAACRGHDFLLAAQEALVQAGVQPGTLEPEYGRNQYEISCAPAVGVAAGDAALIARETIRAVGRSMGLEISFTPKPSPESVGNGAHVHLSLRNADGVNVTMGESGPLGLSETAAHFAAGILEHADALTAISAPSPVSYYRLGPDHWSCGYRMIGVQNREAMLRVMPGVSADPEKRRAEVNIEYRPADATASPYLTLGALVRAGLDGIARKLALPAPVNCDLGELSEAQRRAAGVKPLPTTLAEAIAALESDPVAKGWFHDDMFDVYRTIKLWEHESARSSDPADVFAKYRKTY